MLLYQIAWALGLIYLGFCLILVCGLVYSLFVDKGKRRWLRPVLAVLGLAGLSPLILFAIHSHHTVSGVSGTYQGIFSDGTDVLTLLPNGAFRQHYVTTTGRNYTSAGKWRLHKAALSLDEADTLSFDKVIVHTDSVGQHQTPKISSFSSVTFGNTFLSFGYNDESEIGHYVRQ